MKGRKEQLTKLTSEDNVMEKTKRLLEQKKWAEIYQLALRLHDQITMNTAITKKVVINRCFGGFNVSKEVYDYLGLEWDGYGSCFNDDRENKDLVRAIEELGGAKASGECSCLEIVEIPKGVEYDIEDYDGVEHVAEKHRTWE